MQYDILIIGAGICGCAAAYTLSKYKLNVLLLDKENDVSMGATRANSGIVHAGYDPKTDSLMAKFNVKGSRDMEELAKKLDVPYKKTGSLVIAFSSEEDKTLKKLYERGLANGVSDLKLISGVETLEMEPNLNPQVTSALWAQSAAVISPWELSLAMAEVAVKNGVTLSLSTEVKAIKKANNCFLVETNKGELKARLVINAAGVFSDKICQLISTPQFKAIPSKGEYFLLDKNQSFLTSRIIFQCPTKEGKGVLVAPTAHGNIIVGPNSESCNASDTNTSSAGLSFVKRMSAKSIPSISFKDNVRNFAGIRANTDCEDFIFGEDVHQKGFYNMAGIKSPGLSSAVAMAQEMAELIKKAIPMSQKESFCDSRSVVRFSELSHEKRAELIAKNPLYGRVICRCETITEGEIMDAINSPVPPVSIDGIKRRCGSGMGRCQGGFCSPKIHELLAKLLNKSPLDIPLDRDGSYILTGETKQSGAEV